MDQRYWEGFKESRTYKNLRAAFDAESRASTRYALYGQKAKEEGYEQIGNIFHETAKNELEHAAIWLKLINKGCMKDTLKNLEESYKNENHDWTKRYIDYAQEARSEGYCDIAEIFEGVAAIERHHDARFRKLAKNINKDRVFTRNEGILWICTNCGNVVYGDNAPKSCPVCGKPQGFYQQNVENY